MQQLTRPDGSPVRVLVVDDEVNIAELLAMALRYEGWDLQMAHSGQDAVATARDFRPDAVVLDIMLPDFDGLEVLRRMRADGNDVPVLFLTAKDAVEDRIAGLTAGGDDYVTKPFSLEEVVARLRGLIRRGGTTAQADAGNVLVVGDLTLDEDSHEVQRAGVEISLTATEFELLRFLMRNPRRVLSKAQILDRVWQYDFGGQANVVELYISYLRKKVDAGRDPMIHTMRGAGYVLKPALMRRPLTLTTRLVALVVLLVAVTAMVIGGATTLAMRGYFTDRLDDQVRSSLTRAEDPRPTSVVRIATTTAGVPGGQKIGTLTALLDPTSGTAQGVRSEEPARAGRPPCALPAPCSRGSRSPTDGEVHEVPLPGLGNYRVIASPTRGSPWPDCRPPTSTPRWPGC